MPQAFASLCTLALVLIMLCMLGTPLAMQRFRQNRVWRNELPVAETVKFLVIYPAMMEVLLRTWFTWDYPLHGLSQADFGYLVFTAITIAVVTHWQIGGEPPPLFRADGTTTDYGDVVAQLKRIFNEPVWLLTTACIQTVAGYLGVMQEALWPTITIHILYNAICLTNQAEDRVH